MPANSETMNAEMRQALPRVCFVDIPETAGNSIKSFFVRLYRELAFDGDVTSRYDALSDTDLARYRFYTGHVNRRGWSCLPSDTKMFTVVRDPVERAVSLYKYWNELDINRNRPIASGVEIARSRSLEEFLISDNELVVQHLRGGLARSVSERCDDGELLLFRRRPRQGL